MNTSATTLRNFTEPLKESARLNVLAVSAHPDDVELGCGATLRAHSSRGDNVYIVVTTYNDRAGRSDKRCDEQRMSLGPLGVRAAYLFDFTSSSIKDQHLVMPKIRHLVDELKIDVVYTPFAQDTHSDHISTTTAVIPAARGCSILCYQLPSTVNFTPNLYVPFSERFMEAKKHALTCHASQVSRKVAGVYLLDWIDTIGKHHALGLSDSSHAYAEAFYTYRLLHWLGENGRTQGGQSD